MDDSYERRTRAAREDLAHRYADHFRAAGQLPDSRRIEARATEAARRNDRRDSDRRHRLNQRPRGRG